MGGGADQSHNNTLFRNPMNNANRQFPGSFLSKTCGKELKLISRTPLCCNSKFCCASRGHVPLHVCGAILESDEAVVGLITVRTAQIWGRKIASEIIALNARSQDFGGLWRWNHPLILNS